MDEEYENLDGDMDEDEYLLDFSGGEFEDDEDGEDEEESSRTYKLDLDKGRIIGMIDGIEAVEQSIRKAVATPRFDCLIYDDQYGSESANGDMATDATESFKESAIEGFIRDALSQDTRITDIGDFSFEFEDDNVYVSFSVSTIFGDLQIEEVI